MHARLETELTSIELRVDEALVPDALVPIDYQGPVLVAIAHANRIVSLTPHGRVVRPLSLDLATSLAHAAALARKEHVKLGVDTAFSRTITTLRVRVDHPRGSAHSYAFAGAVNHLAPHALPEMWSALLVALRDAIGELRPDEADCWDRALTWTAPIDLGFMWHAGAAVRVPHRVTCIEPDGPLYLRTGQPGEAGAPNDPYRPTGRGRSLLYRLELDGVSLTCLDDRRVVAPDDTGLRWHLPCGGGVVMFHHEWLAPPRVVIRVDDHERGIYVQRGDRP